MRTGKGRDIEYYVSLALILGLGLIFVIIASPNKNLQFALVIITTLFYILFGIVHHLTNHDISVKVVLEYLIIGLLGISILFLFLKGGLLI